MVLEFSKVVTEIDRMGQELAQRTDRQLGSLRAASALLGEFAGQLERLKQVAESPDGERLRCAGPLNEALNLAILAPQPPATMTLVASDGSQIYPDPHGPAFYFVINVGSIVFRRGSGQAPEVATEPRLFYTEPEVYPEGRPASSELVSALRDIAEMRALADLTVGEAESGPPRLGLGDGPLLIWLRANLPAGQGERTLSDYLDCLDRLRASGAPVAGFVSRPRSAEVVTLLYLAQLTEEERAGVEGLHRTEYQGLVDRRLFSHLQPGERSALFVRGAVENQAFRQRGHEICFFYLNTGSELARVEVPSWVASSPAALALAHASIYEQCQLNNGYPYVLTRADEEAVILGEEREMLEELIAQAMLRHGLPLPELSRKAQQKQVARWRRKR